MCTGVEEGICWRWGLGLWTYDDADAQAEVGNALRVALRLAIWKMVYMERVGATRRTKRNNPSEQPSATP